MGNANLNVSQINTEALPTEAVILAQAIADLVKISIIVVNVKMDLLSTTKMLAQNMTIIDLIRNINVF